LRKEWIAEVHALVARLVMTAFRIREKKELIVVALVKTRALAVSTD
jgi:hypothetical protein